MLAPAWTYTNQFHDLKQQSHQVADSLWHTNNQHLVDMGKAQHQSSSWLGKLQWWQYSSQGESPTISFVWRCIHHKLYQESTPLLLVTITTKTTKSYFPPQTEYRMFKSTKNLLKTYFRVRSSGRLASIKNPSRTICPASNCLKTKVRHSIFQTKGYQIQYTYWRICIS